METPMPFTVDAVPHLAGFTPMPPLLMPSEWMARTLIDFFA
jgi:hypothetical protein